MKYKINSFFNSREPGIIIIIIFFLIIIFNSQIVNSTYRELFNYFFEKLNEHSTGFEPVILLI